MSIEQKIAQILAESLAQNQGQPQGMGVSPYDPNMGLQGAVSNTLAQYSDPSLNVPVQPVDTGAVPGNVNPFNSDEGAGQQAQPDAQPQGQPQGQGMEQPPVQSPTQSSQGQPEEDEEDDDDKENEDDDEKKVSESLGVGDNWFDYEDKQHRELINQGYKVNKKADWNDKHPKTTYLHPESLKIATVDAKHPFNINYNSISNKVESIDVSSDVDALVEGENLTEEFKEKAATIFEAAVITRVRSEVSKIEESYNTQLNKEIEKLKEGLVDKVDGYLDYVVEQWFEQNEIALESGMKSEIVEGFIYGLKNLFEEHYIDVPEEKFDVMESLENQVNELKTRLNEQIESTVKLRSELNDSKAKEIVSEIAKGLAETDKEKFKTLTEDLTFDNSDSYKKKVQTIRESYFKNNKPAVVNAAANYVINNEPVQITEETVYPASMKNYLSALDKLVK